MAELRKKVLLGYVARQQVELLHQTATISIMM
jgi:hypothetical protein